MYRKSSTASNISSVSRRLRQSRQNSHVNHETLVHWYRSHHNGLHSAVKNIVNTEESENEYVIDDPRYHYKCNTLCSPYAKCYMRVKKIRAYRHYVQATFEEIFKTLRWIDLPGGQHRVAIERNYLMNYIWLMSFITGEVDTTNKDSARHIRYRLEELLINAENLGVVLQKLFQPLQVLARNHALIEEMGDLLQCRKIPRPRVEKKILRLQIKPDNTMLIGNKVDDFNKLLIYVRKDCQIWSRFKSLTESDKVDVVTKGLQEAAENLKDLKRLIKHPLRAIKAGEGRHLNPLTLFLPTLIPHVQQMRNQVKVITSIRKENLEGDDRAILESLLSEVSGHFTYVLKFGELLVEEIWDIILMVRMSYNYVRESPQNNIITVTYNVVVMSKFSARKIKKLLKASNFTMRDFLRADCADTLRKLPVVVSLANAELSLHLQGHKNSRKSRISAPSHRFTFKTRASSGASLHANKLAAESANTNEPKKLMFVSEGD